MSSPMSSEGDGDEYFLGDDYEFLGDGGDGGDGDGDGGDGHGGDGDGAYELNEITAMKNIQKAYKKSIKLLREGDSGELRFYKWTEFGEAVDYVFPILNEFCVVTREKVSEELEMKTHEKDVEEDIASMLGDEFWNTFEEEIGEYDEICDYWNGEKEIYYFFSKEKDEMVICLLYFRSVEEDLIP